MVLLSSIEVMQPKIGVNKEETILNNRILLAFPHTLIPSGRLSLPSSSALLHSQPLPLSSGNLTSVMPDQIDVSSFLQPSILVK